MKKKINVILLLFVSFSFFSWIFDDFNIIKSIVFSLCVPAIVGAYRKLFKRS